MPYWRVSSDDQERDGISLPTRMAMTRKYAAERGLVLHGDGKYQDVLSGKRDDRKNYQRLLADGRAMRAEGKRVAIIVSRLDRLGRRLQERVRCQGELEDLGVSLHSVREGGEMPPVVRNTLAVIAEEETRRLGERVSEVWEEAMARGWHFIGRILWGYLLRDATDVERTMGSPKRVLDVDPAAEPHVKRAFERVAAGDAIWGVVRDLQAFPEHVRGKRGFNKMSVRRMLTSPTYIGRQKEGEDDPDAVLALPIGQWPALVSDDVWLAVQRRLERNRRIPTQASQSYLLTGLLYCPVCGARMSAHRAATGYYSRFGRYACSAKGLANVSRRGCTFNAGLDAVETAVRTEVAGILDALANMPPELPPLLEEEWQALQRDPDEADREQRLALAECPASRRSDGRRRYQRRRRLLVSGAEGVPRAARP